MINLIKNENDILEIEKELNKLLSTIEGEVIIISNGVEYHVSEVIRTEVWAEANGYGRDITTIVLFKKEPHDNIHVIIPNDRKYDLHTKLSAEELTITIMEVD